MCLAIPMQVIEKDKEHAMVRVGSVAKKVNISFVKNIKKGDYIIVHAGFAIEKLDKGKAMETLKYLKEMML